MGKKKLLFEEFIQKNNKILRNAIRQALGRYDDPEEPHNVLGGYPRPEVGWAMAQDLRKAMERLSLTNPPVEK